MFSPDGTLISASAAPHCGDFMIKQTGEAMRTHILLSHLPAFKGNPGKCTFDVSVSFVLFLRNRILAPLCFILVKCIARGSNFRQVHVNMFWVGGTAQSLNLPNHHHQSLNREGRWGTTDDFATSFLHFSLFSTALWDLPNSRPVHSLMLSSHLFLCPPCLLPPFTVPCKMVFARPDERET